MIEMVCYRLIGMYNENETQKDSIRIVKGEIKRGVIVLRKINEERRSLN